MKYLSSHFSNLSEACISWCNLPPHAATGMIGIGFFSTLLVACGGSSGSGAVLDSQPTIQDDGSFTQAPAPSTPNTQAPQPGDTAPYNLGSTPRAVIDQCMSDTDKEMLSHVNAARSQGRDCGSVNYPASTALSWHCTLENAASAHSRDMGDHNFFSHTGSDGLATGERVRNAGYDWAAIGENIAAGQQSIDTVMTAWLDSPGHCANIMHASYTEFGAASYTVDGSDFPIYWTQVFTRPKI